MTIEIGDCMYPRDDPEQANHTAVDVEGACIRGLTLYNLAAHVCGECIYWQKRKHLMKEQQENQPPMDADGRG